MYGEFCFPSRIVVAPNCLFNSGINMIGVAPI